MPETASVNKIANKVAWGAIAGGTFDPPTAGGRVSTYNILPNVSTQNISMRRNLNRQFEGTVGYVSPDSFDPSTGSAFRN